MKAESASTAIVFARITFFDKPIIKMDANKSYIQRSNYSITYNNLDNTYEIYEIPTSDNTLFLSNVESAANSETDSQAKIPDIVAKEDLLHFAQHLDFTMLSYWLEVVKSLYTAEINEEIAR